MADITPTVENLPGGTYRYTWTGLTQSDTQGVAVRHEGAADRTVQIVGTFGTGTCIFEGSLNETTFATLTDPQGNAISKTGAAIEAVLENALTFRPRVTGADGATALTVIMLCRRTN